MKEQPGHLAWINLWSVEEKIAYEISCFGI
jgi:hypothetical protein